MHRSPSGDPANGSSGVPTNAVVEVLFNEPVNPLTVMPSTLYVGIGYSKLPGAPTSPPMA